jgi:hypothetical protein
VDLLPHVTKHAHALETEQDGFVAVRFEVRVHGVNGLFEFLHVKLSVVFHNDATGFVAVRHHVFPQGKMGLGAPNDAVGAQQVCADGVHGYILVVVFGTVNGVKPFENKRCFSRRFYVLCKQFPFFRVPGKIDDVYFLVHYLLHLGLTIVVLQNKKNFFKSLIM